MSDSHPKSTPKAGLKTTEFWVSLVAVATSFVISQGFVTEDQIASVVSVVSPVIVALGYNISRGLAKS